MSTTAALTGPGAAAPRDQARLGQVLQGGELGGFRAISDVAACLLPLLDALGWRGDPRRVAEALPHFANTLEIEGLRGVLANLNYQSRSAQVALRDLDPRLLPCLFTPNHGSAMVLLRRNADRFSVFDGASAEQMDIDGGSLSGQAYLFTPVEPTRDNAQSAARSRAWVQSVAKRFRGLLWQMCAITFLSSILALALPLFIMSVYDQVIPGRSTVTLVNLLIGVLFALAVDGALRLVRARILAYIGGRIDMILGSHAFQQILHLPVMMTERSSIGAQISRLRQFEAVREFFTGPLSAVFLELPFVVIFVAVIAWIGGPLAWIPVVLVGLFALCGVIIIPITQRTVTVVGELRSQRQSFLVEMLSNLRAIKTCGVEAIWSRRHRELAARTAMANFRSSQVAVVARTIAQLLMLAAGIATLAYGTLRVMDGHMTIGALVASMALIWRVLAPLQQGFLSLTRLEQITLGLQRLNLLMRIKPEREPGQVTERHRNFTGRIAFRRLSLRYTPQAEPALLGVELTVEPGQVVAITGANGSGKSTVLKMVAGLYQPQAGAVLIDGIDIRQLDCAELRDAIAYVPQTCHLFHGTIAQNLRLADPTASDTKLAEAALHAALVDDILGLPDGFDTRLTDRLQRQLPTGFKQRLMLARAYVKDVPIYLLDEPGKSLDEDGDAALMRKLQQLRGRATVLMTTQRPSHMRLADKVVLLEAGRVMAEGPPDDILPKIMPS